ncbi:(2Fe-2S) ferredoxin domain-containing protein [Intestinimonas butyriciproducens]|uniref:(2Fe-2S) ferredoxin domain-containing protein n=1 Tax=Intestinimonas butyriciproducens TaxID=1297617 RepID=UPI00242F0EB1|nr:(2Fe-2S) ferredoxin domain-containing protein [Intestinimonas butyriciproducens]MCI6364776.1 (2Fe-2S) ferredoxin domain-containing protein [Intestinimonas butyriciproducens]MDY3616947.1 (2Fe-2S) ferredoxin domain-containing protein [Intestinimonas butyriciproducens]
MKSLEELRAIRERMQKQIDLRENSEDNIRVVVGMATCGIAAGARPVLTAFLEEVAKRELKNVTVTQTGCIGVCRLEPIAEVYVPGEEKVTYVKLTPEMVPRIVPISWSAPAPAALPPTVPRSLRPLSGS